MSQTKTNRTWAEIFFLAGHAYAQHIKQGGRMTERQFIIEYLSQNYIAPIPLTLEAI